MNRSRDVSTTVGCGLAEEIVRNFGEVRLRVFGTSMVPSILPGDMVSVQHAGPSEICSGEIVVYARYGRLIIHRVVESSGSCSESLLVTRGDRLFRNDASVSSSELLGRVTSVQTPDGRWRREVRPAISAGVWQQFLFYVLRTSDRATGLYLRLARRLPNLFSRGPACRA
jgi:signal peptidase I